MVRRWIRLTLVVFAATLASVSLGARYLAADAGAESKAEGVTVLDTAGVWRIYHTMKMPVIEEGGRPAPIRLTGNEGEAWQGILSADTAPAPDGWAEVEFDDSVWLRGTAIRACRSPFSARIYLRGKFTVTEPSLVQDLTLHADYHGGIIVRLNGEEVARRHVPPAGPGADGLAESYGEEAYISETGELLDLRGNLPQLTEGLSEETLRRYRLRERSLAAKLPATALRRGLNVLGIEVIRSPYHEVLNRHKAVHEYKSKDETVDLSWNTCEIRGVRLIAESAGGLEPNAVRPPGYQLWNSDMMATDYDLDFGDRAEPLRPVRIICPRGGAASGKIVVGSDEPIEGLRAKTTDLESEGGATIPASRVRVRYALPWTGRPPLLTTEQNFETVPYPAPVDPLMALSDEPLDRFPVREKPMDTPPPTDRDIAAARRYGSELGIYLRRAGSPGPVFGAVVPVWVTVSVPRDAEPGAYSGDLTVAAGGRNLGKVPVSLKVADFTLPEPRDFRTWVEVVQSPDTLAVQYDAEMWSDRHFELIAQSLRYLGEVGSRVVYVPLIARTNLGNAETMVRWVERADGTHDFDFSVMDRYLDLVEEHMGKPRFVVFNVFDLHLGAGGGGPRSHYSERAVGNRPMVTLLDPSDGSTENVHLAPYEAPGGAEAWGRLFSQLRDRMRRRGLEQAMVLGMLSDIWPSKEQVSALKEATGDLPWSIAAHGRYWQQERALYDIARIAYHAHAFATQYGFNRSLMGWKEPQLHASFERWGNIPITPPARWRAFAEIAITGSVRGVARVGGDFWPVEFKSRRGRVTSAQVWARYPEADLKQLSLKTAILAPGPNGPVATSRFEAFREGLQEAEARIVIEAALSDPDARRRMGPQLVERCEAVLADRLRAMWRSVHPLQVGPATRHSLGAWRALSTGVAGQAWYLATDWQTADENLFGLTGEVRRALADQAREQ